MKKSQVKVGGEYIAKVNNKLATVKVDYTENVCDERGQKSTRYFVTNLKTGRRCVFRSAAKFRREVGSSESLDYCTDSEPDCCEGEAGSNCPGCGKLVPPNSKSPLKKHLWKKTNSVPHLIVEARAGTGKTTTLIEGLKVMRGGVSEFTPSFQQAAVWDSMALSEDAKTVCFVAFNKSIATELQSRVPTGCEAMTMHSMGYRSLRNSFGSLKVDNFRVQGIMEEITGKDIWDLKGKRPTLVKAVEKLVSLCKMNLTLDCVNDDGVFVDDALLELAAYHDVDLNGEGRDVIDLVPKVLERCKNVAKDNTVDYDDMIWLPIVLDLPVTRYDLLLVDEAQDLNRCQQQLALKAGHRLILVGDSRQAIYGFAGADSKSMERMQSLLLGGNIGSPDDGKIGCQVLPLTVTRRCGKAIVEEAQKIVPDFEAHESCCEGLISQGRMNVDHLDYRSAVEDGNMILCRVNAPLVSECFKFLKAGRKANIQGRDVGQGLISTIKKIRAGVLQTGDRVELVLEGLSRWIYQETTRENAKKFPSEARLIALQDRYDCLCCFCEDQDTVEDVIKRIEDVFTDDKHGKGIKLSSVHRAKGLEADRVFILLPENAGMPHPMAKTEWQIEQEWNLKYVAITRAISELVYVT